MNAIRRRGMTRGTFLKKTLAMVAGTSAASVGCFEYATRIEPTWLDVHHVSLTLPRLHPGYHGYRMVQFSDIHMGYPLTRSQLTEIVGVVNQQRPDLVAITGDFVTTNPAGVARDLVEVLSTLRAPDGIVAVLGNHDYWTDAPLIRQVLRDSGIVELDNRVHSLARGKALFHVAGVDDVWAGHPRLDRVLAQLPATGAAILLAHEPDFADASAATGRFDLQLSGHSHGGQVVLPFYGPLRLPPYGQRYPTGGYHVGAMIQYTTRGVGMLPPFVRFDCRPEVTVFTLAAAHA